MCEEVDKELSCGLEKGGYFGHQQLVVLHVLEELDAEDAVEFLFERRAAEVVGGDVAGDYLEILEASFLRLRVDVLLLCS